MKINYKYRQFLFFLIKLSIVVGSFYFIYQKTIHNNAISLTDFVLQIEDVFSANPYVLFSLLVFTFFNWVFEILKWQNLVFIVKKISFITSLKQSLGSLTASLFTPNRIGEYGVKAFYFYKGERKKIILLNVISNFSQMFITIVFGLIGLYFFITTYEVSLPVFRSRRLIFYFSILVVSVFGGKFLLSKKIRGFYWSKIILFIKNIPSLIFIKTIIFSIIRYVLFSHQLYYLLLLFGVEIEYSTLIKLIFTMYLIASIIPSLPMFDWLIKGSVAVFIFSFIGVNELIIVSIVTLMWLFNFALPAIIGSYFVMNFKYITKVATNKQ